MTTEILDIFYYTNLLKTPNLPAFYNKEKINEKICLSYFISILYDKDTLDILIMYITCMPNGELEPYYKNRPLKASKNLDKTMFNFEEVNAFEILELKPKRVKIVYYDSNMNEKYKKKLTYFKELI